MLRLHARASSTDAAAPSSIRKKSAIMIFLAGGPSHLDTYDLKPDAPAEFRGEFQSIATKVPGVRICELLPRQAKMWDKLAVIRSIAVAAEEHSDSSAARGRSGHCQPRPRFARPRHG
jgi:hypothetical protein